MKSPIAIFIVALLVLLAFLPSYKAFEAKRKKIADYEAQINQLHEKNRELAEELKRLEDDPEYLEKVAREKMGIAREGEVIYRIETVEE